MLKEEQAAELLRRCEKIVGHELPQIRGNLRNASSRSAALWELLVLEAVSYSGRVEYEPLSGPSPDIRLYPSNGKPLWIEVAYLYPRFWKQERKSQQVLQWLYKEADRRDIPSWKIYPQLDGDRNHKSGPIRRLPELNERKKFLKENEILKFFNGIVAQPNIPHNCSSSNYTVSISYNPKARGPYSSASGLLLESPKVVEEHAVYRVLRDKAGKHKVNGPLIIFVGSDQSDAVRRFSGPGQPRIDDAVWSAFSKYRSLSAVIVMSIEDSAQIFALAQKQIRIQLFLNRDAKQPLTEAESQLLSGINMNKWKYTFALPKWEYKNNKGRRRVAGSLKWSPGAMGVKIEVPANIVVDSLAGKTSLFEEYDLDKNEPVRQAVSEGWVIVECSLKEGNIEAGEAPKVVLKLMPPLASVFWPKKES
jgi:hypothetical protein